MPYNWTKDDATETYTKLVYSRTATALDWRLPNVPDVRTTRVAMPDATRLFGEALQHLLGATQNFHGGVGLGRLARHGRHTQKIPQLNVGVVKQQQTLCYFHACCGELGLNRTALDESLDDRHAHLRLNWLRLRFCSGGGGRGVASSTISAKRA